MSKSHLPRNWQEIGLGDLVVAQQSREDGWYEAIVVEANGDMLTLRWRDYPRERRNVCHRLPARSRNFFASIKRHPNVAAHHSRRSQRTVLFALGAIFKKNENLGRFSKARSQSEAIVNDYVTFRLLPRKMRRGDANARLEE